MSRFALVLLLVVSGCKIAAKLPNGAIAPDLIRDARDDAYGIISSIGIYEADGLSRFERPELDAVEEDSELVQNDSDPQKFLDDVEKLKRDWDSLVGLDLVLQREYLL